VFGKLAPRDFGKLLQFLRQLLFVVLTFKIMRRSVGIDSLHNSLLSAIGIRSPTMAGEHWE